MYFVDADSAMKVKRHVFSYNGAVLVKCFESFLFLVVTDASHCPKIYVHVLHQLICFGLYPVSLVFQLFTGNIHFSWTIFLTRT